MILANSVRIKKTIEAGQDGNMKIQNNLHGKLILAVIILMVGSLGTLGQEFRGTIAGTVTDPNGAVVAGATVVVKNKATNVAQTVATNDEGSFSVPFL